MVIYNIQTNGPSNELVIELINDGVYLEPSVVAYVVGEITLDASIHSLTDKIKAYFVGKKFFRPVFRGTGKIYLKPTLGSYHKFSLKEAEQLVVTNNAFIACRDSIKMDAHVEPSLSKFLSGTPMITNIITGPGNVVVQMPGEVTETALDNGKFVAYSTNVAAYSPSLIVTRELASNSGSLYIANVSVTVYRGTGSVFFTPHPNKDSRPICK